jgi:hypothetical protein
VAALRYLAAGKPEGRLALLQAWNRRLARGAERRPLDGAYALVAKIAASFRVTANPPEVEALLEFMGGWPRERESYIAALRACLGSHNTKTLLAGLTVQQRVVAELDANEDLIRQHANETPVVEAAIKNYAFDTAQDHAEVLRRLWPTLKADDERARYNCLFSMDSHPKGNDAIALAAVLDKPYALFDVAGPVLAEGDPALARQAIRHVLDLAGRGREEALRLARQMKLDGFEKAALAIATDKKTDQILRQAALLYLSLAEGSVRRQLLPLLADRNNDLRLTAIQAFATSEGLSQADRDEIGPALIQVAQHDVSMGHRQEAIFTISAWGDASAADFFRTILASHPAAPLEPGHYNDDQYWHYRLRLVALLGLAKLGDRAAIDQLLELHSKGGPAERMDVLLAFRELKYLPEQAFADLDSPEPKLIATAAELIKANGDAAARKRMEIFFRRSPLWLEFRASGLDDHNLLEAAGLEEHHAHR